VRAIDPKLVLESYEEHALAELALKRLLATDPSDASFKARVKATKELIAHHVEEEEEDLFPKCDKKLGDETLEALGKRMKDQFDQVMQHGFEATVPKGFAKTSSDVDKRSLKTTNGQREAHAMRG
jgi:hemerythrin-like domain-containing protein